MGRRASAFVDDPQGHAGVLNGQALKRIGKASGSLRSLPFLPGRTRVGSPVRRLKSAAVRR
ncbi:hypothetical protein HYPDE_22673 [Hyphomicrobium denitrificans 1NES1]|uniref:Uncharacterized protein n=1 Tax=Hyphomicrobium denitrificans 1NES1 TaxID=670307 RepID=N0B6Q7_9HYPH|nr:hypothetical protein HYPDE_22673 [Hyphomicrobium denitrificans 1NES1]